MKNVIEQITTYVPDAKPVQSSASFQGLAVTALAPVVIPLIIYMFGLSETDASLVFTYMVTAFGALWGLYGVVRRSDIRLPWQKVSRE